ncbi:hypothetical protein LK09_04860 [Microbacterium mangrovi]|uniref:DUF2087 domain-containing protein n=1 Tax=Microbacterium mangrovi TaxID=1348253 RepID=A0A0B2A7A7_9MICO|nr:hypothetical protein LK09_04860 [Microbacterium mangrovi]
MVAALANDDARRVFARLVLEVDDDPFVGLSPSRRSHVRSQLENAGLIREFDGEVVLAADVFAETLRRVAVSRPTGIQRFLRDERIVQYPARPAERLELLGWVARTVLRPGEVVAETDMNDRLSAHTDDVAALRRYLVDAGLVERTPTGSEYALPA